MKRKALLVGLLAVLLAAVPVAAIPEREPNDESTQAMVVPPGTMVEASFSWEVAAARRAADDTDHFRVSVTSPGVYTITVTPGLAECEYWVNFRGWAGRMRGTTTFTVELTGQRRTNLTRRRADGREERTGTLGEEPRELTFVTFPVVWSGDSNHRAWQCAKDGAWYRDIPYRLTVTAGAATPPDVVAQPPTPPQRPDSPGQDITIAAGSTWETEVPVSRTLELLGRIAYDKVAGANWPLEVWVNGQRVTSPLANKRPTFTYADGRTFPHLDPGGSAWMLLYSPDFTANDTAAGGGYRVLTDPGQAYRYRWDVASLVGTAPTMRVRLYNNGRGANRSVIVRLGQATVVLPPPDRPPGSVQPIVWTDSATPYRGRNGQQLSFACPGGGSPRSVFGTDTYTDDSSICTAAVHAGLITLPAGGTVTIEIRPGLGAYAASFRNGVSSGSYGSWVGSYVFVGGAGVSIGSVTQPAARPRTVSVVVRDDQGRPLAGSPVRFGRAPCVAEGTTDASGVAVLTLPSGVPCP